MTDDRTVLIATKNKGKSKEINDLLNDFPFKFINLNDLEAGLDIDEDGSTYEANATRKARAGSTKFQLICIGEDSGLEVEALGRQPGIRSARYAGEGSSDKDNNRKLLSELRRKRLVKEQRKAHFVSAVSLALPDGKVFTSVGKVGGLIASRESGKNGFGYDPLFYLPEFGKTFAQLSLAEKNRLSHRARAVEEIKKYLKKLI